MLVKVEEKSQRCHIKKNGGSIWLSELTVIPKPYPTRIIFFISQIDTLFFLKVHHPKISFGASDYTKTWLMKAS